MTMKPATAPTCASLFDEKLFSSHHPVTIFSKSRSVRLLLLSKTQHGAQNSSFCVRGGNSTEHESNIRRSFLPWQNPRTSGYLQKGSSSRVTGVVLLYILFIKYDVWIPGYFLILLHVCRQIFYRCLNLVSRCGSEDANDGKGTIMGGDLRWISSILLNI